MATVTDIATYLAAQGLGLSIGSTGNLFAVPFPETAPNASVCIIEYGGAPALRAMADNIAAPVAEIHRVQVVVRDILDNFATAETLANDIHNKLDHLLNQTLSGTRYLYVRALAPPFYLSEDDNARHRFACNYEALRER